jgi:hypothetical protein
MIPEPVRAALDQVIPLLVADRMEDIERIERGGRMKAGEWRRAIAQYGRTLTTSPSDDFDAASVVPMQDQHRSGWSVWYRLWTKEEGRADLGVQLTVYYDGRNVEIEADDLRVA